MAEDPLKDEAEVEIVCPRCGYHATRAAARLRRDTPVMCPECGGEIVPPGGGVPPPKTTKSDSRTASA